MTDEAFGDLKEVADHLPAAKVAPAEGIAAIALSIAMKYHAMSMIPDGLTYQQYKMEGRNIREIGLHDVFETAIKIEMHLLGASDRIAQIVVDAVVMAVDDEEEPETPEPASEGP